MTTIIKEQPLYSFFDLSVKEKQDTLNLEDNLKEYAIFAENLLREKENFTSQCESFWKSKIDKQTNSNSNQLLKWINMQELMENKKNLPCDVSLNAFKNLIEVKNVLEVSNFSSFDELDNILPNFKEVTNYYRGAFALNQSRPIEKYEAPRPILLLGDPGIGKTYYAKQLAKILSTTFQFIDANGISASWVLCGHNKGWKGADAGLIFKLMAKSPTISPILLIDEFDKLSTGKNYDPNSTFHQMFEKENAKQFYDELIETSFNASQIIYILTANDKNFISPTLLSRMTVFEVKNPTQEEMRNIIPHIYQEILASSTMFKLTLQESEINKLVNYTPREVYQVISNNLYTQASEILKQGKKRKQSLVINNLLPQQRTIGF